MKNIALAALVLAFLPVAARAERRVPQRPVAVACEAPLANEMARSFRITRFDTKEPGTNLDARIDGEIGVDPMRVEFCANNGCDNSYCFVFFTDDLDLLARGKTKEVTGLMNYFNAEMTGEDFEFGQTVPFTCRVTEPTADELETE
jgi:hypothetical protein